MDFLPIIKSKKRDSFLELKKEFNTLLDIIKIRVKNKNERITFQCNIGIFSFLNNELLPVLQFHNTKKTLFTLDESLLTKFNLSEQVVNQEISAPFTFNSKSKVNVLKKIFDNRFSITDEVNKTFENVVKEYIDNNPNRFVNFIPLKCGSNNVKVSGVSVLYINKKLSKPSLEKLQKIISGLFAGISIQEIEYISTLHATRAAISQVMARNMSHNIGSHVLSKLLKKEQLHKIYFQNKEGDKVDSEDDVKKLLTKEKVFYQCLSLIDQIDIDENGKITTDKESNESLLATFFQYLKARMDFLADVTTNTPVIENTKGIFNDIVKPFISNRVLNDRISGIDEFRYEIIVCKPPTNKYEYCVNHTTEECRKAKNVISSSNDVMLSIPNDILGSHAFYTILENIIRNTAKHGTTPVEKNNQGEIVKDKDGKEIKLSVEFKIKVEEASIYAENKYKKDDKRNILYDKMPILKNTKSLEWDWNEFYAISIFDNCDLTADIAVDPDDYTVDDADKLKKYEEKKIQAIVENGKKKIIIKKIDKLVIDQNFSLNKSILENNQLRHGAWGLIEMDASAAYLRKIDIELIDSDKYRITCLHGENPVTLEGELAIMQAYAEQGRYLGYRFFIRKPQEILIIGDDEDLSLTEKQKDANIKKKLFADLKNEGVWIYSKKDFLNFYKDTKQKAFPHKLVVLVNAGFNLKKLVLKNKACFSKRVLCTNSITLNDNIKKNLWVDYFDRNKINCYNDTVKGKYTKHGHDYCDRKEEQFIEIWTSLTDHYFSQNFSVKDELFYKYSWPIKIAVVDERIQSFSKERYKIQQDPEKHCSCELHNNGVKYIDIYRKTNIFIPEDNEANLNLQNFDDEYENIISYIKARNNKHEMNDVKFGNGLDDKPCEFVVIHMGIIEKLISSYNKKEKTNFDKEKPEDISKFIKEVFLEKNKKRYDSIVITSGRGKPHNLPPDIRYLNFSVVSNYMITLRNKFAFTEATYSARKQN